MPNEKEEKKTTETKETKVEKEAPKQEVKQEPKAEAKKETKSEGASKSSLSLDMKHWSLRKVAFLTIIALGVLHLLSSVLSIFKLQSIVAGLQTIASAVATTIVAILSWSYAAERNRDWKIIYFVCLAVVVLGIIIPLVF